MLAILLFDFLSQYCIIIASIPQLREEEAPMSDDPKERAAELLEELPAYRPLGTRLFNAVARLTPTIAFEAVALRWTGNTTNPHVEVFMTRRGPDKAYPNQWHVPGSIFRNNERPVLVLLRLAKEEFQTSFYSYRQVAQIWYPEKRSWTLLLVYLVGLEGEPPTGSWFAVSDLPEDTVVHHRNIVIPEAVRAFTTKT